MSGVYVRLFVVWVKRMCEMVCSMHDCVLVGWVERMCEMVCTFVCW